ncbi:tRNA 2-thiocytidine(32) synthetase TtcA [Polaribacter reichenbachii]|uniref:tRNA-cytidine(32) 2-sulfurtransferase n=1 Tax=Polaribacter reichenbachii TaxID=996801 RepID=A0A1B8TZZ0_9FLAO|nr:tRNA 2-thiocytidine(32) synthetase TtcA [Polaribacter reichenbachii]APZ47145.1 tRNA 2-thiocytidine(32) synthetase TtcA [Polaribacter reichenbachii]AUC17785.1 tRNA 2-thiocytidine(32) synthetase TtcA [Polaribacter reichenbachii]OBY65191.1 tRNA 2-thiocytidine(32) synthetase TtcA [Polaribacter reichenbachii]
MESIKQTTKKLQKATAQAIQQFTMIAEGDKIMVCLSGGKDSYTLLDMLMYFKKVAPISFDIIAVNLDQKQPNFPEEVLPNYLTNLQVDFKIIEKNTYKIVMDKTPEGKTTCSLCSRLRRGTLYEAAKDLGCNKLALGHHRNDILETFFLNFFFAGKMETMPPKFKNDAGNLVVLRPLSFCKESDIETYSNHQNFPIIPCNLCGSQENLQRKKVKQMITDWESEFPNRNAIMMNALQNVFPSHLLDQKLYDFDNLESNVYEKFSNIRE